MFCNCVQKNGPWNYIIISKHISNPSSEKWVAREARMIANHADFTFREEWYLQLSFFLSYVIL
jgi:hypothetical protein